MPSLFKHKTIFRDKEFWFLREVELPLDGIHEYINKTDRVITKIHTAIETHDRFLEEASAREIKRSFKLLDYYTKKGARDLYYNSVFITEYSFLERKMLQLCKIGESKKAIKINDLGGSGIFKYYSYLKKVLQINMDEVNEEWQEIVKLNHLRNLLVHHPTYTIETSSVGENKTKILKSIKYVKITEEDDILEFEISDKTLLQDFVETIREFLAGIYYDND